MLTSLPEKPKTIGQLASWQDLIGKKRRTRLVQRASTPGDATLPLRSTALAQVRSVHVSRPSPQVAEVSVHVRHGQRSRALALRLDLHQDRWVCTALEFS